MMMKKKGGREQGREGGREGGRIWIWIWIWVSGPILRLTGRLGRRKMAFPTALQIGWPCHVRCIPQALHGPFPAPLALGQCLGHAPLGTRSAPGSTRRPHPAPAPGRRATQTLSPLLPQPLALPLAQPLALPQPQPRHALAIAAATIPHTTSPSAHCPCLGPCPCPCTSSDAEIGQNMAKKSRWGILGGSSHI